MAQPRRFWQLHDAEWLRTQHLTHERSITDIATGIGCSREAVRTALRRFGIRESHRRPVEHLRDASWLHQRYEVDRMSTAQIADLLGCAKPTVRAALIRAGIQRRHPATRARTATGEIVELLRSGESVAVIARRLGVAPSFVYRVAHAKAVPLPSGRSGTRRPVAERLLSDPVWLRRQYVERDRTLIDIGVECGVGPKRVRAALAGVGIPVRYSRPEIDEPRLRSAPWLRARLNAGATAKQIGEELGVAASTVSTVIQRLGAADGLDLRVRYPQLRDAAWLQSRLERGQDFSSIAAELGCARSTVWLNAQKLGLRQPPPTR